MKNIGIKILIGLCIVLFITAIFEAIIIKKNVTAIKNDITTINNQTKCISELKDDKEKLTNDNKDLAFKIDMLNEKVEQNKKIEEKNMHPIEKEVQDCIAHVDTKYITSTFEFSACIYKSEEKWEKEIKKFLVQLKKPLTNEEYTLLLNSQKDWERYRNSQIKFIQKAYRNTKATIYHNYEAGDIVGITEDRARYLYWASDIMKMR